MFQFVSKVFTSFSSFVTSVFNPSTATGGGVTPDSNTLLGYDTTATTETVETITKEKKNLTPNGEIIIGVKSPRLLKRLSGIDTTTFDTTTYGDSAIIKLTNNSGSTKYLLGLSIRGKIVLQLSGQNGYVWEYSDYDAIEKEGEKYFEVSNDFIFDPVQAKQVGDFVWKELKPHKLYALALVGCHYEYEIGDVYHLTLEHTMNNGTMENIDTDVEVLGTSINRSVGGVGVTQLNLRVPSEAWSLTLAKNSKLVGAANSQRLNNRSNIVTVAASDWTGQADYFCDGTDDNVEIQAAIDYVYIIGGGSIILTSGTFNISTQINYSSNIIITGQGSSTKINIGTTNTAYVFVGTNKTNVVLRNFDITSDSSSSSKISGSITAIFQNSSDVMSCENINIYSVYATGNVILFHGVKKCNNCTASYIYSDTSIIGFYGCSEMYSCSASFFYAGTIYGNSRGFRICSFMTSCTATSILLSNSSGGTGFEECGKITNCQSTSNYYGYIYCSSMQQNRAFLCTIAMFTCYADSAGSFVATDTANGGFNS